MVYSIFILTVKIALKLIIVILILKLQIFNIISQYIRINIHIMYTYIYAFFKRFSRFYINLAKTAAATTAKDKVVLTADDSS